VREEIAGRMALKERQGDAHQKPHQVINVWIRFGERLSFQARRARPRTTWA